MVLILSVILVPVLTVAIVAFLMRKHIAPARLMEQLGPSENVNNGNPVVFSDGPARKSPLIGLLHKMGGAVPASPQQSKYSLSQLGIAGFRSDSAFEIYLGIRLVSALMFFFLMLVLMKNQLQDNGVLKIVLIVFSAFVGYTLPSFALGRLVKRRLRNLRRALPDALDLLVVCVEAGLGLDQALQGVSTELASAHKDLCDELTLTLLEMRAGKRRNDALKTLGDRTQEPELRRLVTTLTQSDRFGTSLGEALRAHSDFMRVRRRQDAEERAAKVGVKLVFPIFLFILPSMLVVSIGPGLLQLIKGLMPMLKSFGT
jgi:tight adherence protein C